MQDTSTPGGALIYAQVAVSVPARARGLFTYAVAPEIELVPGNLVAVPLASRTVPGIVAQVSITPPGMATRQVLARIEDAPSLGSERVETALWIAHYYRSTPFQALSLFLPPGWTRAIAAPGGEAGDAPRWVFRWPAPPLADGAVVTLAPGMSGLGASERSGARGRAISFLQANGPASISMTARGSRCAVSTVRKMVGEGLLLEVASAHAPSSAVDDALANPPVLLNPSQVAAFDPVARAIDDHVHQAFLLHGVTGSGKTHVYLQLIEGLIRSRRQAIVLVSEIAQTPEALDRYAERFPGRVALMHSDLPLSRRVEMWRAVREGCYDVVIGPRSALFAPVPNLGLIVLDEEHEPAYKQEAPVPRYHARDVALELGRRMRAPVVLGSATPDVASYHLAERGVYRLLSLPDRYSGPRGSGWSTGKLPYAEIVDLREELRAGNGSILSRSLQAELERTLDQRQQAILFLNRRGSATCVLCRDCGHVMRCRRCDVPMVYHKESEALVCHHCGRKMAPPAKCPECRKSRIGFFGAGTERVASEVTRLFPSARVLRWDHDVAGRRGEHARLHRQFRGHEAEVLVGTQMVAKALDFPLVTLVGVVLADVTLHLPDFRSAERTFQLLAQVAGRAGRGAEVGKVVIQTYSPNHYSVVAAAHHDYRGFYRQEIAFRRYHSYPPFRRLVRLLLTGSGEARIRYEAIQMKKRLQERVDELGIADISILGPAPAFHSRLRGHYRWQLVLAGDGAGPLLEAIDLPLGWTVDVDPASLL